LVSAFWLRGYQLPLISCASLNIRLSQDRPADLGCGYDPIEEIGLAEREPLVAMPSSLGDVEGYEIINPISDRRQILAGATSR
jgi:hypothetical protein